MSSTRKKILILDDGMLYRVLLTLTLTEQGYETISFDHKAEGCEWLQTNQADLIISDIESPGLSGFEFIKLIKADARLKNVPIIFLSWYFTLNIRAETEAKRLGAFACITKPFAVEELLMRVEEALTKGKLLCKPDEPEDQEKIQ